MQPAAASASCVVIVVFDVCLDQGWLFVPSSSIGIACIFRGCFNTANAKMKGKNALTGKIKPENFFLFLRKNIWKIQQKTPQIAIVKLDNQKQPRQMVTVNTYRSIQLALENSSKAEVVTADVTVNWEMLYLSKGTCIDNQY